MPYKLTFAFVVVFVMRSAVAASDPLAAFQGAEGYGAVAAGGRGGALLFVTRTDDVLDTNGEPEQGTLRWAMTRPFPRIILFRTGGVFEFNGGELILDGKEFGRVTVAGQSAPGGGVCIRGRLGIFNADDVVLRYFRVRSGRGGDAVEIRDGHRIIVDHLSVGWGGDEQISIVCQATNVDRVLLKDVTIQRCLIGECNAKHPTGTILGSGRERPGRPGLTKLGSSTDCCAHHNLWVHCGHRFPNVGGSGTFMIVNNVIHNWQARLTRVNTPARVDHINNVYQSGPATEKNTTLNRNKVRLNGKVRLHGNPASIYTAGNLFLPQTRTKPELDDWDDWTTYTNNAGVAKNSTIPQEHRRDPWQPLTPADIPIQIQTAVAAFESVLGDVGCNARLDEVGRFVPNLDSIDTRYLTDVRERGGPAEYRDTIWKKMPYPDIEAGTPYPDTDGDGMSDTWERANFGNLTTAEYKQDHTSDSDRDGYSDLEEFLNGTTP